jgi:hypothetical protein
MLQIFQGETPQDIYKKNVEKKMPKSENKVVRTIFEPETEKVSGQFKIL